MEPAAPEGVVNVGGEWYYEEYARGGGVGSLGVDPSTVENGTPRLQGSSGEQTPGVPSDRSLANSDGQPPARGPAYPVDERRSILDLFRN
jgi:penicillin-binding protein 1A